MKTRRAQIPGTEADYPHEGKGVGLIDKLKFVWLIKSIATNPQQYKLMNSWKTTVFGTGGVGFIIFNAISQMLDGNPATNPDWGLVIGAVLPAIGLIFARDHNA